MKKQISTPIVVVIVVVVVVAVVAFGIYSVDRPPPLPTAMSGGPPLTLRAAREGKAAPGSHANLAKGKFLGR